MRVAILGSGGVGGYFGGRLAAHGADVTFIARGAHLAAMQERGLRISSPDGNVSLPSVAVTDQASSVGPVDVVLFAVKLYDTESALAMLPPMLAPHTVVVPLQNGVESVDRLAHAIGREHVAGGTCYVSAVIAEPGVIRHTAMSRLIFGPLDGTASKPLTDLYALCQGAGFEAVLSDRVMIEIWAKFARLSVFSGMTAVTRSPIGVVMNDPELAAMATAALHESFAVARASGIPLDESAIPAIIKANRAMPPGMKSSMLEDLERGRRLELPFLSGAVVRRGRELGVPTPVHAFIATVLKPHVGGEA
jgi:2-dehydropantoate 2-reductase